MWLLIRLFRTVVIINSNNFNVKIFVNPFVLVSFLQSTGIGADPDPSFRFDADQDPIVHIDSGPDPAPFQGDANLRPLISRPFTAPIEPPRLHCERPIPSIAPF
jgi:hypothetical protein